SGAEDPALQRAGGRRGARPGRAGRDRRLRVQGRHGGDSPTRGRPGARSVLIRELDATGRRRQARPDIHPGDAEPTSQDTRRVDFRILGPLAVDDLTLAGARQRAVLAVLLLHANEAVSADRLVLALWGEEAPPTAVKALHVAVSRLRRDLGAAELIETT